MKQWSRPRVWTIVWLLAAALTVWTRAGTVVAVRICFGIGAAGVIVAGVRAPPLQARGARFAML